MDVRSKRLLIRISFHALLLFLLFLAAVGYAIVRNTPMSGLFSLLFLVYAFILPANRLHQLAERRIISVAKCQGCGESIPLLSHWSCGCGFRSWKPRNALMPCDNCGKYFSFLECPYCSASIPI